MKSLVSENQLFREPDVEQVSQRLHESLSTCRSMIANYRSMIEDGANDNQRSCVGKRFTDEATDAGQP